MPNESPIIASLRREIERKYREALGALDTISGYLGEPLGDREASRIQLTATINGTTTTSAAHADKTTVDVVLGALNFETFKTVETLSRELELSEASVRAVLYSKFVKRKLCREKVGKKFGFKRRKLLPKGGKKQGDKPTVSSLVRGVLEKHDEWMSPSEITQQISTQLEELGVTRGAVGAALYNLKTTGKIQHDETAEKYRLVSPTA